MADWRYRVGILLLAFSAGASAQGSPFRELADLRYMAVASEFTVHQFSSFDRSGHNMDFGNFLREENDRKVLAEMQGSGEIVRIWSANPTGLLEFYLDGYEKPAIAGPFEGIFTGQVSPFSPPISTTSSGGFISYHPIPYRNGAVVKGVEASDYYYHLQYRAWPQGLPEAAGDEAPYRLAAERAWGNPAAWRIPDSWPDPILAAEGTSHEIRGNRRILPGQTAPLASLRGSGYIQEIRLLVPTSELTTLRQTRLTMRWDRAAGNAVDVPLLDYLGSSFNLHDYQSLPLGRTRDGWRYIRFAMPFRTDANISLVNQSRSPLQVSWVIQWQEGRLAENVLYYRAGFSTQTAQPGKPIRVLETEGRGQFVGCQMSVDGPGGLYYLEGDEQISVDGRPETDFHGTGTEDYLNSGWYFATDTVGQPLHGAIHKDEMRGQMSMYRFHLTDRIPYRNSFRFNMEHGGINDAPGTVYWVVSHWYSERPSGQNTPQTNAASLRVPVREVTVPPHTLPLTGMKRSELSGGQLEVRRWEQISDNFSGGPLFVFRPKQIGNAFTLDVSFPYSDRYFLSLWTGTGPGLGKVRVSVNDRVLGDLDLYSTEPNHPARLDLGEISLPRGVHRVRLQSSGKNPASAGLTVLASHLQIGSRSEWIEDWLLLGPFDGRGGQGFLHEYIDEGAWPIPGRKYEGKTGEISWQEGEPSLVGDYYGPVDPPIWGLKLDGYEDAVWYAATIIEAAEAHNSEFLLGSDDGVRVWLNGRLVHSNNANRGVFRESDIVKVRFNKGDNLAVFKVYNDKGPSGLAVQVRNLDGLVKFRRPD